MLGGGRSVHDLPPLQAHVGHLRQSKKSGGGVSFGGSLHHAFEVAEAEGP